MATRKRTNTAETTEATETKEETSTVVPPAPLEFEEVNIADLGLDFGDFQARSTRTRSDEQVRVDNIVKKHFRSGSPAFLVVSRDEDLPEGQRGADRMTKMVRSAITLYGYGADFLSLESHPNDPSKLIFPFIVREKRKKKKNGEGQQQEITVEPTKETPSE